MLALIEGERLVFWPRASVAMVRREWEGRLEVLSVDGRLGHRPGPLEAVEGAPFVRVSPDALVHPGHARQEGDSLVLVDGWRIPGTLREVPPPEPPRPDPMLPGTRLRMSRVLYLKAGKPSVWVTDRGEVPADSRRLPAQLARQHPDLVGAGRSLFVNRRRLRRLSGSKKKPILEFDSGHGLPLTLTALEALLASLGLQDFDRVGGETEGQLHLRRLRVRRWPQRLFLASAQYLRERFFGSPERLIADLVMQTVEARRAGLEVPDGTDHRAWFYLPGKPTLYRAGHMVEGPIQVHLPRKFPADPLDEEAAWGLTCRVMTDMVGKARVITYRDLGFRSRKPEYTILGRTRPHVVVLVEKESLLDYAHLLSEAEGVTCYISGGVPPLIGSEFLVEALRAAGLTEVDIVSCCDHDVVGYDMPEVLSDHCDRYGMPTRSLVRMITPECFTAEEIERLGVPIPTTGDARYVARVERWMRVTGGTLGRCLALHANQLQPFERVLRAFRAATLHLEDSL